MFQFIVVVAGLLAASVAVAAQPSEEKIFDLAKRVFLVGEGQTAKGTGFRVCKPNLILTAAHVIDGIDRDELRVQVLPLQKTISPTRVERHPEADVAALFFDEADTAGLGCFDLGVPSDDSPGQVDYLLAEDVGTFGFPTAIQPLRHRLMKGHIQAHFRAAGKDYDPYRYVAYELSFSSFRGMSGSPVFRDVARNSVIAVVAVNFGYTDKKYGTREDWTTGVALPPLAGWLKELDGAPSAP